MKPRLTSSIFFPRIPSLLALVTATCAHAATLTWDSDTGTTAAQDGGGNWTAGGLTFWDGTTNVATANDTTTDIAQFGNGDDLGSVATVNVDTQSINGLIFGATTTSGYELMASTSEQVLTIGSGGIVLDSGAQATTLGSADLGITVGANQSWTNNSSSLFTVAGGVSYGNFNLTLGTGNTTVSGSITGGTGVFAKNGTGTLTLSNASNSLPRVQNFRGTIEVTGGLSSNSGNGFSVGEYNTGTLNINGGSVSITGAREFFVGLQATGTVNLTNSGSLTIGSDVTIGIGSHAAGIWGNSGTGILAISSGTATIQGTSSQSIFLARPTTNNTATGNYSGTINVTGGTLETARTFAEGPNTTTGTKTSNITLNNGGRLRALGNNSNWIASSIDTVTFGTTGVGGEINTNGFNMGIAAPVSGNGFLRKSGAGTLTLSNASNTVSRVQLFGGTLDVTGGLTSSSTQGFVVGDYSNANLSITGGNISLTGTRDFAVGLQSTSAVNLNGGSLTIGTDVTVGIGSAVSIYGNSGTGTLAISNGTATIQGDSSKFIYLTRPRTDNLANGNYTGTINVTGGTLETARTFAEGPTTTTGTKTSGITLDGGTLKALGDNSDWIASSIDTLTFDSNGATIDTNGFAVAIAKEATGSGSLTKSGAGTLTLSGALSYSGNTTVNSGTLSIASPNGSNESSIIDIASGAKLQLTYSGNDTVGQLFINDVGQNPGTYGHSNSGATNGGQGVGFFDSYFEPGSGTLTVPATPGFAAWQAANGGGTIDADHDGDGVSNGIEYFIYGPVASSGFTALPPVDKALDGTLSVTWTKAAGYTGSYGAAADFVVETSDSLAAGTWVPALEGAGADKVVITGNEVKYTFPAGTKKFARLKVTGP